MKRAIKKHIGVHHINSWKTFVLVSAIIFGGILCVRYSIYAYPQVFSTEISLEKNNNIGGSEPVVVDFSQPVSSEEYVSKITVTPANDFKIRWENSHKKLLIIPKNFWKPETEYVLSLPEGRNILLAKVESAKLKFSTVKLPRVKNITPADGAKDIVLDIEDPIVIDFDKSSDGFFLKFLMDPESHMSYQNNKEKTQFKLLPEEKPKDGESYKIKIYAKYANDSGNNYYEIFSSSFSTLPPAPTSWAKDYATRLDQARRYTIAKITNGKYIDVNLSAQIMSTFENGKLLTSNMISSGKRGMETTKGQFSIINKAPRVWSKRYGLYMPYWMAVASDGSFGIHELPEWPGGYKEGAAHLGIPVSHGCIRLGVGPAKETYDWAEVGTPVVIY